MIKKGLELILMGFSEVKSREFDQWGAEIGPKDGQDLVQDKDQRDKGTRDGIKGWVLIEKLSSDKFKLKFSQL